MTEKRFTLAYEKGNWWAVRDGDITLWKEEVIYLLNELHEENIELHIQNVFLKDENQHMKDLVNENQYLKELLMDCCEVDECEIENELKRRKSE